MVGKLAPIGRIAGLAMEDIPSQVEIDAVAHYIEAALELRRSPFFIEEYRNISLSTTEGAPEHEMKGHFPDSNVVAAMLVPFRRLWQHNEPCNYQRVANILKKYMPEIRSLMDSLLISEERSVVRKMPYIRNIDLPLKDVINIWLNTQFMHVGEGARVGQFSRQDFERFQDEIGAVLFEFYFLSAVHEVGICFFNIQQFAASFLQNTVRQGLDLSFTLKSDPSEVYVQRETPGFSPNQSSGPQNVWRLRRRSQYDGFNRFLDIVSCTDKRVSDLAFRHERFDEFLAELDTELEYVEDFSTLRENGFTHFSPCIDNYSTVIKNRRMRRGFVAKRHNGGLVWLEEYKPILVDQYKEFREALVREPFV